MTNYNKIKLAQAVAVISLILTLLFAFSWSFLLLGLAVSWTFYCLGLSICLHKYSSHKTFNIKNKFVKYLVLWFGTVVTMGSTINFAAGHRQHHKQADTIDDPYCLQGSLWHKIKLFFYWFPAYKINPMIIKDLLRDRDHVLFNNNYWKILLPYPVILLAIDPVWFGYFYALPVTYVLLGMGYVTVIAHLRLGHRPYDTNDNSWDSNLFAILLAGEGYHNTHHAYPGRSTLGPLDTAGYVIELIKEKDV